MEICIKWSICRTCTSDSSSQLQSIFDDTRLADQLLEYAGLVVKPKDGLPDQICAECVYSLQLVHTFLTNCKRADTHLKNAVRRTMSPKKCFPAAVCLDLDTKNSKQVKAETDEIQARNQIIAEKQHHKILNTHLQKSLFISDQEELVSEEEEDSTSFPDNLELVSATQSSEDSSSSENGTHNEDLKLESKCEQIMENENEYNELITVVADEVSHDDDNDEKKDVINAAATATSVAAAPFDVDITACAPSSFKHHDCTICGNEFRNAQHLKSHMRTHSNERSYECELCSKRFNAACNLTTHMRTHTGEKPYPCVHCGRRFADRSTHRKHERMHTNERPYACTICGKTFSLSTTLKAHALSHSKEKPHKCVTCNKGFRLPHQLKAHEKTHVHRYEVDFLLYN